MNHRINRGVAEQQSVNVLIASPYKSDYQDDPAIASVTAHSNRSYSLVNKPCRGIKLFRLGINVQLSNRNFF